MILARTVPFDLATSPARDSERWAEDRVEVFCVRRWEGEPGCVRAGLWGDS